MSLSHFRWLCIILPTLIAATPQKTAPTPPKRSLPPELQQVVPACAQPCLRASLSEQFPFACTTPVDLGCLCSRYSFNGQSLGEVALGCIAASCSTYNGGALAYNVCLGERYAVTPTLTALTVVARTSSTSTSMTSFRPIATTHSSSTTTRLSSTTTSTSPSQTSHTDTVFADSVSLIPSPTSTSPQGTNTPVAAGTPPPTMTPAQIAGLAVAAGAGFIIAIGLMALSIFLRRRRERKYNAEANEKGGLSPASNYSTNFAPDFAQDSSASDPPRQFLLPPPPVKRKSSLTSDDQARGNRALRPLKLNTTRDASTTSSKRMHVEPGTDLSSVHPLLRPSHGASRNASNSSVPLDQIGLAISGAELPKEPIKSYGQIIQPAGDRMNQQRPTIVRRNAEILKRPDSVMTQSTMFEEDEVRRESKLLPAPPIPIPPIRTLQPSRSSPAVKSNHSTVPTTTRQLPQPPELFLDIPPRYKKSQPWMVDLPDERPRGTLASTSAQRMQLPTRVRTSEYNPKSAESDLSNGGDIPDYYFTAYQKPKPIHAIPSSNANRWMRTKQSQNAAKAKPKRSSSTVSRTTSRASTNIRDSISSQTSFETDDRDDPTPEDDNDDRRLEDGRLSPVAESPIHRLRYPKVPRTSNQLVPRSPKSPQSQFRQGSPRWQPQPSSLLVKRKGEQGALQLGSSFSTGSPNASASKESQKYRQHLRSNSVENWSPVRNSERTTRTQSSLWPKSPAMYEPNVVRPLTIRKTQLLQTPNADTDALKSPVWVPRLTPTRQGDDLLISVTYSQPGH